MDETDKKQILNDFSDWWRNEFAPAHKAATVKLADISELTINPFLWPYLAYFLRGKSDARSLAEVLILPRVLSTSPTTIFGTRFQQFVTRYFRDTFGSTTPGIDIEFIDKIDGRKKYCQLKAGPNVVNKDGAATVKQHFDAARRLARTNNLDTRDTDYVFGLLYGETDQQSTFIQSIAEDYPVYGGQVFWYHFTGDPEFYADLVRTLGSIANEFDMKDIVEETIEKLAADIIATYPELIK